MYNDETSNWSAFIAGAFIGAGVALLLAPQSGSELRSSLREYASRAKDELDEATEQGRAVWDSAMERGQEYMERGQEYVEGGKQAFRNAGRAAREFVDESVKTAEKTAEEATSRRG
jgi:gas vesicle protein